MLIRAQEMARYVSDGVLDAGLTGQDWIAEHAAGNGAAPPPVAARRSRSTRNRASARCAGCWPCRRTRAISGRRISRARPSPPSWCARRRPTSRGIRCNVNVEFSWGATEVKPPTLADAIVEVTETGSSLRANRLRIIDTVLESNTQLIANADGAGRRVEADQAREHRAAAEGGDRGAGPRRHHAERAASAIWPAVLALLPALQRPTISPLSDTEWVAVNTIIEERTVRDLIPRLKAARAQGIVEYPLNKIVL